MQNEGQAEMNTETPKEESETVLTPEALTKVLQRVALQHRLGACASVSKAWHTAAVAATKRIELLGCTQRSCSALETWLGAHGDAVDSLAVSARFEGKVLPADAWYSNSEGAWHMPQLQLPAHALSGLTRLSVKLIKCHIDGSSSSSTGVTSLEALTALKELQVTDCVMQLRGISALTALERLKLQQGWGAPNQACSPSSAAPAFPSATAAGAAAAIAGAGWEAEAAGLSRLTRLQHLTLAGACCSPIALLGVQHLQQLQELVLGWQETPQPVIAGSEAWCLQETLDDTTLPGLAKLTRLQKLVVSGAVEAFDPALLEHLPPGLQHLQLDDVRIVMTLGRPRLAALQGFTQLTYLSINNRRGPLSFLSADECAALTTSSKLQFLGLSGCQVPSDGCSKMLRAEWQLPVLQQLTASPSLLSDPAAVALLGICCPKLQGLVITLPSNSTQRPVGPVDLSALQQVIGLTQLVLTGVTIAGAPGFRALGQLSGLRELVVGCVRGFRLADVMQLTPLKELRALKLVHMQLTEVLAASLSLTHQGTADTPANVWLQLAPELLKQALWLYPFRSLPTPEDLTQVAELIHALQMHFLAEPCPSDTLGALQQQMVSFAVALLQLQQQRVALAAALGGGPAAAGHPLLQQLQQQTHGLREQLIKCIAEALQCIKSSVSTDAHTEERPLLQGQQQQPLPPPESPAGPNPATAVLNPVSLGLMKPPLGGSLTGQVGQQLLLQNGLRGPAAAGAGASLASVQLLQQQLQLQQGLQALGPTTQAGLLASAAGLTTGRLASESIAGLLLQQQHQQEALNQAVHAASSAAGYAGIMPGGLASTTAEPLAATLAQQQQQLMLLAGHQQGLAALAAANSRQQQLLLQELSGTTPANTPTAAGGGGVYEPARGMHGQAQAQGQLQGAFQQKPHCVGGSVGARALTPRGMSPRNNGMCNSPRGQSHYQQKQQQQAHRQPHAQQQQQQQQQQHRDRQQQQQQQQQQRQQLQAQAAANSFAHQLLAAQQQQQMNMGTNCSLSVPGMHGGLLAMQPGLEIGLGPSLLPSLSGATAATTAQQQQQQHLQQLLQGQAACSQTPQQQLQQLMQLQALAHLQGGMGGLML